VQDRCLPIELERQSREQRAERFREREAKGVIEPIRAELEALAQQSGLIDALRQARPALPDELNDRQQDITEPLLAIADRAGAEWPVKGRAALTKLCAQEEDASISVKLLADIKHIYDVRRADKLPTMDILAELIAIEDDRPWAQWWEDALKHGKPKGPAARLAKILKRYKIKPCKIRIGNETVQGYHRADFLDGWKRYLPASMPLSQKDGTNGTDGTKPQFTRENVCSDFSATTRNVPTSQGKDGTRIHEGKTTNVPSVPSSPERGAKVVCPGDWLLFRDAAEFAEFWGAKRPLPETCIGFGDSPCPSFLGLVDEPGGFYYHRTRHIARCRDCQEEAERCARQ